MALAGFPSMMILVFEPLLDNFIAHHQSISITDDLIHQSETHTSWGLKEQLQIFLSFFGCCWGGAGKLYDKAIHHDADL